MDIFESLENLPVSESCFEDIISIVEEIISESQFGSKYHRASEKSSGPHGDIRNIDAKGALKALYKPKEATLRERKELQKAKKIGGIPSKNDKGHPDNPDEMGVGPDFPTPLHQDKSVLHSIKNIMKKSTIKN